MIFSDLPGLHSSTSCFHDSVPCPLEGCLPCWHLCLKPKLALLVIWFCKAWQRLQYFLVATLTSSLMALKPPHVLHWLLVGVRLDVGWGSSFSAESPLTTVDLMVGKLVLRLSYLLLPHFRVQWKLLGSSKSHGKREQLERGCTTELLSCGQSPNSYGHVREPGPPGNLLPGFQVGSGPGPLCPNYSLQLVRVAARGEEWSTVCLPLHLCFLSSAFSPPSVFNITLDYKGWASLLLLSYILSFLLVVLWLSYLHHGKNSISS